MLFPLAPVNLPSLQEALASPRGWVDLALVGLCIGIALGIRPATGERVRVHARMRPARATTCRRASAASCFRWWRCCC